MSASPPPTLDELLAAARRLLLRHCHLFFLHQGRFLDPLVPRAARLLAEAPVLADEAVMRLAVEDLPATAPPPGIYFPIPIARAVAGGQQLRAAIASFRYELIRVDAKQRWWWRGSEVAARTRAFFVEHLAFEPALDLYYFEYRVNAGWWDKCYLDAEITPILGSRLDDADGRLRLALNTGGWDEVDPASFRLDHDERLFCRSARHGDVLLSDWARFGLLKNASDDGRSLRIGSRVVPLAWSERDG